METAAVGSIGPAEYVRALRDDFDWLRHKWREFHELYEKGQERIDLLNATASNFFYFLQRLFFEDAMLHLCRLTDPPRINGHETLTVRALAEIISDPAINSPVRVTIEEVRDKCTFARRWRDQRLAHMDLETMRLRPAGAPDAVVAATIGAALKSIDSLLTFVEGHFGLPHSLVAGDPWGARSLIWSLEKAKDVIGGE